MNTKSFTSLTNPSSENSFKMYNYDLLSFTKSKPGTSLENNLAQLSMKVSQFLSQSDQKELNGTNFTNPKNDKSILKFANSEKLVFSKSQKFPPNKLDLQSAINENHFTPYVTFIPNTSIYSVQTPFKEDDGIKIPVDFNQTPFNDNCDAISLIFSKEKNNLYLSPHNCHTLTFGESPEECLERSSKHKKGNFEKEKKEIEGCIANFLIFKIKNSETVFPHHYNEEQSNSHFSYSEEGLQTGDTIQNRSVFKSEQQKSFSCEFCTSTFSSHQGLGGHVSRSHKDQSFKMKKRKEGKIRRGKREGKKLLCEKNNVEYEQVVSSRHGKIKWKKIILQNRKDFKKNRRSVKENINQDV